MSSSNFVTEIVAEIKALIIPAGGPRNLLRESQVTVSGDLYTVTIEYNYQSEPAWAPSGTYTDLVHHLLVISVKGSLSSICASETIIRQRITRKLTLARPISRQEIVTGFVGDEAKALWLDGIHTRSDAKPDAKTLMGRALEFAIDPLGDQTYAFKAVRSRVRLTLSNGAVNQIIGASPDEAHLWLNRPKTWGDFVADTEMLLDVAAAAVTNPPTIRFPSLAQAENSLNFVADAYEITVAPPELLAEDTDPDFKRIAAQWAYGIEFTLTPTAGPDLTATVIFEKIVLGNVSIAPVFTNDRITLNVVWIFQPAHGASRRAEFDTIVKEYNWLKIYYSSGHTISGGMCFRSTYTDQWFPDWKFIDLTNYDVTREKPIILANSTLGNSIGMPTATGGPDDSLFGYCHDTFNNGWLASDDGSMELADFVHIDDTSHRVTLIHAKGASSQQASREVSASKYEVVIGQAVKNLRHLERKSLADALDAGRTHLIADAVWHNGNRQLDRSGLIARVRALPSNYPKRVIILQPQLTRTEHNNCITSGVSSRRGLKMKQLNTLLLAARLSMNAVGADLEVWGQL